MDKSTIATIIMIPLAIAGIISFTDVDKPISPEEMATIVDFESDSRMVSEGKTDVLYAYNFEVLGVNKIEAQKAREAVLDDKGEIIEPASEAQPAHYKIKAIEKREVITSYDWNECRQEKTADECYDHFSQQIKRNIEYYKKVEEDKVDGMNAQDYWAEFDETRINIEL